MEDTPDEPEPDPVGDLPWHDTGAELDDDLVDREIHARVRAQLVGEIHQPLYVGRFRLLRKLGQGAMGTVHAAYDEALDREVALKLLHPRQRHEEQATLRLRREATALAQLSHPNLVPVFEVGEFEGQVFLAMELVSGGITLAEWIGLAPRSWQQVLGHWLDVARALAAVHEARLVHRDIKPSNVLMGADGRARLVDFGLVRGQGDDDTGASTSVEANPLSTSTTSSNEAHAERHEPASGRGRLQQLITEPRATVGTPAYMAPELRMGAVADPRADQFSLCVSIYENLYGHRPPPVARDGSLVGVPDSKVPLGVRRALTRGLAPDPGHRFSDVRALVQALERTMNRGTRRLVLTGAVVLAAAVGAGVVGAMLGPPAPTPVDACAAVDDDLDGVWAPPHRDALREAIEGTAVPYAPRASRQLERLLQAHATAWLGARRRACEATAVEHTQSEALLDRRMACLDAQRQSLAAMLETTAAVTPEQLPRLPMLMAELPDPAECLDDSLVSRGLPPPPASAREQVEQLHSTIARLRLEAVLAGPEQVWAPAEQALTEAEQLGYRPLQAEASLLLGVLHQHADDPRARPYLERAADLAETVDHVELKEQALGMLARLAIDVELDARAAERLLRQDFAVIERLGAPPRRLATAMGLRAALATLADDHVAAEADLRQAVALLEAQGERLAPVLATTLRDLGNLLVGRGRLSEAETLFDRAGRLDADWGGTDLEAGSGHTVRGRGELVRGLAATRAGRFDEAASWLERARHESAASYGEQSVPVGRVEVAMADLALRQGRLEHVLAHAHAADACFRRWLGDDHQLRASALAAIGTVAFHLGRAERSVEAFAEELRLSLAALPAHGARVAMARSNLGEALVLAGRHDEAELQLEQALADLERVLPAGDVLLSFPAHALAEVAWHRRDLDAADRHARRALAIREQHSDDPIELARTRWLLARVEHARARPAQARALAQGAHDGFVGLGPAFADQAQEIDRWLRSLP